MAPAPPEPSLPPSITSLVSGAFVTSLSLPASEPSEFSPSLLSPSVSPLSPSSDLEPLSLFSISSLNSSTFLESSSGLPFSMASASSSAIFPISPDSSDSPEEPELDISIGSPIASSLVSPDSSGLPIDSGFSFIHAINSSARSRTSSGVTVLPAFSTQTSSSSEKGTPTLFL